MAVEIPVVVDIDAAFAEAAKRVPQAIAPLEAQISKHQLNMDVNVGTATTPKIRKFKDLLSDSQSSATQLARAIKSVNDQIKSLSKAGGFNPAKGLKSAERDLLALRSALEIKKESGNYIDNATKSIKGLAASASIAGREANTAVRSVNAGLRSQNSLLGLLTRNLSLYAGVFAGIRLIKNIREVTAEFEMQRVALGGIIQDTTRANQLFGEIKAAAVQSPFQIKDLVRFTKELSAYRVETDKLFDVTMRLADVSAGLGVDMSRLVLAYGQVRAASVLRGQELRQFTEAGIPLVSLLAQKFSQLRGEMVSTGEVFELISDRAVPFSMIEDIFNDMTSAGGIFYEMQLKQSETLKGQWMKLKDVISIAYDEMGRTTMVNNAMTGWIKVLSTLIKNWERIASVVNVAVYSYLAYRAAVRNLIPLYSLQRSSIARQIKLEKQQQIEQIRLASTTAKLSKADQKRIAQIQKMTAEDYKRLFAMNKMNQSQAMMLYWRNKNNKEIKEAITQTGLLTKAQMNAINKMNGWQIRMKVWGASLRTFWKSIGTAVASFWPIALVSGIITTITGLISANREQTEAIKRVDSAYREQEQAIMAIDSGYKTIKKSIEDAADEQARMTKEAESFGQKLLYAQKVVEQLKKFGMAGDFDLSLLNTDNIDEFVEKWIEQLNLANNLTQDWGRSVAQVANAWEASVLGIHFAGDNLNTDIKQLTNAYVKMTSNKKFRQDLNDMRTYVESIKANYKEYYDLLSNVLGEDAELAIAQKRRNETEYQYQRRLIENYRTIRGQLMFGGEFKSAGISRVFYDATTNLDRFEERLNEVEKEFDKTWGSMAGADELTIKMAIDKLFAENQWEDWLKEAWIERVNQRYQMNIQVVPTVAGVNVPKGMKGIIATEFEGLFTEQELGNMNSVAEIGKAIEEKMNKAAQAIADAEKEANNLVNNELWAEKTKEKISKAQTVINDEMAKDEKDRNREAINEAMALIDALTKQNSVYDEQIQKKKENAKAEYDLAKAAKDRLLSEGLSDFGKDIKRAFPGLMKDAFSEATDENYISRFFISADDLKSIRDAEDAYDLFASKMKAIADAREKMEGAGVTEATVAEEQARLDAERLSIESKLRDINEEITKWDYEKVKAKYDELRLAVQTATTEKERSDAEKMLAGWIKVVKFEKMAGLAIDKQALEVQLQQVNAALGAQEAIKGFFANLEDAEKVWVDFGKRYNFTLKDKGKGGSGQDPWILLYKNRMKFMQDFRQGVEDLDKYLAHPTSLGKEQEIMKGRGLSLGIDVNKLKGDAEDLREWYKKTIDEIVAKINSMGGKEFAGLGVTEILAKDLTGRKIQKYQELLQEVWKGLTDFDTNEMKKQIDEKIKELTEKIKRSEAAQNFFQSILGLTGDQQLAASLSMEVYGTPGDDLKKRIQDELKGTFDALEYDEKSKLPDAVKNAVEAGDVNALLNMEDLPEKLEQAARKGAEAIEKYNADIASDYAKLLMRYNELEQERVNVTNQAAKDIKTIEEGLALEIEGIRKNEQIKDKEAAEQKARDRADAAKAAVEAETELQLSRLERDYRMFFSSVGVISEESARRVAANQKRMLTQQFEQGQISLSKYKRELKEVAAQLKKYEQEQNVVFSYMSGGVQGVADKFSQIGDNLRAISHNLRTEGGTSGMLAMDEETMAYVDKIGKLMGGSIFGVEGVSGRKNVADQLVTAIASISKDANDFKKNLMTAMDTAAEGADSFASNFSAGVAVAGFWVKNVSTLIKELDTFNQDALETPKWLDALASTVTWTLGVGGDEAWDRLANLNEYATSGFEKFSQGNFVGALIDNIKGLIDFWGPNIKKINRQIKEQDELVDDLDYQYRRLENAIQKAFGSDYIKNYNQQLDNLYAKQEAYLKQAELEQSKGKKADKDKVKEYQDNARDVADQIEDMKHQLSEFFTGTDLTSAAKDFATAWIDAYKEFGSVTSAMEEKFQDMIQAMVENSLAAQIMQKLLDPIFTEIDRLAQESGELSAADIAAISNLAAEKIPEINDAMMTLMNTLSAAGVSMTAQPGNLTGISRNIAGASEERIVGLAAGINTQNFYMSYMPTISANVAAILMHLTGGTAETTGATPITPTNSELMMGYMSNMDANLAELLYVVRSVVSPKSAATNTHYVAVRQ